MGGVESLIANLVAALPEFQALFSAICYLLGGIFMLLALRSAARRQESGPAAGSWAAPIGLFLTAVAMMGFPALVRVLTLSIFGVSRPPSPGEVFTYAPETTGALSATAAAAPIAGIIAIMQFLGLIAVFRGVLLLNRSAQPGVAPGMFGRGVTFVVSGILAVNFPLFFGLVESLFTGSMPV